MHYLKCNNCGYLNEVKSEYLIFCSHCNKKLENNYKDWRKRNPEKTLEDFMKLICISDIEIHATRNSKKSKPKGLKYWIGFAAAFALFYAIGHFGGEAIVRFFNAEKTSKEILEQNWIKETYGEFGLTVETPVKMTKGELPIPDHVREVVDQMDVYNYISAKGFKVIINSIKYNAAIGQPDLQGAANGAVNEMKMQKGVTDFVYTENDFSRDDIPGFIQKGTYNINGKGVEFINTGYSRGSVLYQVLVAYHTNDEVGRLAAKRVIESVEINESEI